MKADPTSTFSPAYLGNERARRMRNQATGIGQTRAASECTGANRAQKAIDCAPPSQLVVADRSYPRPAPIYDPITGKYYDKATGAPYSSDVEYSLGNASGSSVAGGAVMLGLGRL